MAVRTALACLVLALCACALEGKATAMRGGMVTPEEEAAAALDKTVTIPGETTTAPAAPAGEAKTGGVASEPAKAPAAVPAGEAKSVEATPPAAPKKKSKGKGKGKAKLGPDGKPCAVDDIKSRTCVGVVVVRGGLCYGGGNGACNTRGGSLVGKEGSRVRVWRGGGGSHCPHFQVGSVRWLSARGAVGRGLTGVASQYRPYIWRVGEGGKGGPQLSLRVTLFSLSLSFSLSHTYTYTHLHTLTHTYTLTHTHQLPPSSPSHK